jgi:hypothetical protein
MPAAEQGDLIKKGAPTPQAEDRLNAAIFQKAYQNDELTELAYATSDGEAKNLINVLSKLAAKMMGLHNTDYDIRQNVSEAATKVINAIRANKKPSDFIGQTDFETPDPLSLEIFDVLAANTKSPKKIYNFLNSLADTALNEHIERYRPEDIFGGETRSDVTKRDIVESAKASLNEPPLPEQPKLFDTSEKSLPSADKVSKNENILTDILLVKYLFLNHSIRLDEGYRMAYKTYHYDVKEKF